MSMEVWLPMAAIMVGFVAVVTLIVMRADAGLGTHRR